MRTGEAARPTVGIFRSQVKAICMIPRVTARLMHSAQGVFWLTDNQITLADEADAKAATPADALPSAQERRGQQRQQRWKRRPWLERPKL
jgi:hypothetical protein